MVTGPGDELAASAADRRYRRVSHAEREQVIGTVKAAFVPSRRPAACWRTCARPNSASPAVTGLRSESGMLRKTAGDLSRDSARSSTRPSRPASNKEPESCSRPPIPCTEGQVATASQRSQIIEFCVYGCPATTPPRSRHDTGLAGTARRTATRPSRRCVLDISQVRRNASNLRAFFWGRPLTGRPPSQPLRLQPQAESPVGLRERS